MGSLLIVVKWEFAELLMESRNKVTSFNAEREQPQTHRGYNTAHKTKSNETGREKLPVNSPTPVPLPHRNSRRG